LLPINRRPPGNPAPIDGGMVRDARGVARVETFSLLEFPP
jgi:hypothetical protein